MLDDIIAHDIAQGIGVPIPTTQNCLLPPWARIASRLRAHPTGLALLISEQTFQEQPCIRRNTLLREQRTYPLLDLSKRRRPQRKRLLNRRGPRPRHSNHGCPWIQRPAKKATVMLGRVGGPHPPADVRALLAFDHGNIVLALQIEPEPRRVAEISAQPHRRIGGNRAPSIENVGDAS